MKPRNLDPLRTRTEEERNWLECIRRSYRDLTSQDAGGSSYTESALKAIRKSGDAVSQFVSWFSQEGMMAIRGHPGGRSKAKYNTACQLPHTI